MDIDCPSIDEIEQYIIKQKPRYIFISYYKLVSNKENLLAMGEKLGYIFNKIEEYSKKYEVKFIIAINKENWGCGIHVQRIKWWSKKIPY